MIRCRQRFAPGQLFEIVYHLSTACMPGGSAAPDSRQFARGGGFPSWTERLINKQSLPVRERGSKPLTKVASSPAQGVAPRARARIETGDTRDNPRRSRVAPVRERGSKAFGRSGLA